jgi:hypothetical protein
MTRFDSGVEGETYCSKTPYGFYKPRNSAEAINGWPMIMRDVSIRIRGTTMMLTNAKALNN